MDKNPLEQQRIKIEALKKEMREKYGEMFDEKEKLAERIDGFILQLETLEREGLSFNREDVAKGLKESLEIRDKEKFIAHLLKILEPLMVLKFTQSKIFEKVERNIAVNSRVKLSEVLSVAFENEKANIHLAPATELIKEGGGMANFKKEVTSGLHKLAKIIKSDDKIKEIWATSWIIAKNPALVEKLGFTVVGTLPEIENDGEFFDAQRQRRPIASAFMKREDFLLRYGI
jgi:hypothetical protein